MHEYICLHPVDVIKLTQLCPHLASNMAQFNCQQIIWCQFTSSLIESVDWLHSSEISKFSCHPNNGARNIMHAYAKLLVGYHQRFCTTHSLHDGKNKSGAFAPGVKYLHIYYIWKHGNL